jgi:hypothetical protein
MAAVMIGVDPHKASHTAVAIDAPGSSSPARSRLHGRVPSRRPHQALAFP